MDLGNHLLNLRKSKQLSQEEVAEKLGVTRQTISKWETNQSLPDFDKILPLCKLYEISTEELITGNKLNNQEIVEDVKENKKQTALVISISVFLYFMAVIWIIMMEPIEFISENILIGIFLFICSIATVILVYYFVSISKKEKKLKKKKTQKYDELIALIFGGIYLIVSFITMDWDITWLIWIVYAIVIEIVHLIMSMKGEKNE